MEIKKIGIFLKRFSDKYKFVLLVLVLGILLMWIPDGSKKNVNIKETASQDTKAESSTEESLSRILSLISGAGEVKVMLTKSKGEETLYQEDQDRSTEDAHEDIRLDTVIISDSQRNQCGLIRQIIPPSYMGAIIVCEGAEDPAVKFAIVDAVSKVTGLGADKISVLKMK